MTNIPIETGDIGLANSMYESYSDDEIERLASRIDRGFIFGSWMVRKEDRDMIPSIFLPMTSLGIIERKLLSLANVVHFCAERSDAIGQFKYPVFPDVMYLNGTDMTRLVRATLHPMDFSEC